jgi:tetratricopeptide (TPR) repeat protein
MPRFGWEVFICIGLVLGIVVVFAPLLGNEYEFFRNDDGDYVVQNPHVNSGLKPENISWAFTAFHSYNWHPLTWLSLQLDTEIFGMVPSGYRLTNILLHAANALLLFAALRWMTGAVWPSGMVAGLFAFHPLHVESVAWISERKDVLSALFWMLTLCCYIYYASSPSLLRYLAVVGAFALGLMAKPMLVTLPFVLLLLDFWPLHRTRIGKDIADNGSAPADSAFRLRPLSFGRLLAEKAPLLALVAASCVLTLRAQTELVEEAQDYFSWDSRILNAAEAYVGYLGKMLWPARLGVFYPHAQESGLSVTALAAAAMLIAITVVALAARKARPHLLVGWFWFLGTLVPVIGLVQVGLQGMADRYTYIPLMGVFIMAAWEANRLVARGGPWPGRIATLTAVVLIACGLLTWRQVQFWQNSLTLWEHTFRVTDDNKFTRNQLGQSLLYRGQLVEAQEHFEAALRFDPDYNRVRVNLAACLNRQGKAKEAVAQLEEAMRRARPAEESAMHFRLGVTLVNMPDRRTEGLDHLLNSVALKPTYADAHFALGLAYLQNGDTEAALEHLNAVLRESSPLLTAAYSNLALVYLVKGETDKALAMAQSALQHEPPSPEAAYYVAYALDCQGAAQAARAQYDLALRTSPGWLQQAAQSAWIAATGADSRPRNGKLAVVQADIACRATAKKEPRLLDVLAAAYAEAGRFDEAIACARQAKTLAQAQSPALAEQIQERIHLYEKRTPYRAP